MKDVDKDGVGRTHNAVMGRDEARDTQGDCEKEKPV